MLGAIIGDIVGSPYEHTRNNIKTTQFPLFSEYSRFTDDTVMTCAVAEALMQSYGDSMDNIREKLIRSMQTLGREYPNAGYGGRFIHWIFEDDPQPYNSYGNGSAMRVSPIGWLYSTMDETLDMAALTAEVTHNHPEGIKGAQAVAAAIYLARCGVDKDGIKTYISKTFDYDLETPLDTIRPTYRMDVSCQGSVPQAIRAFIEGNDYENVIRLAVSIGGDSDTIAATAGSIAEAFYGIPTEIEQAVTKNLTSRGGRYFWRSAMAFRDFCRLHVSEPEAY